MIDARLIQNWELVSWSQTQLTSLKWLSWYQTEQNKTFAAKEIAVRSTYRKTWIRTPTLETTKICKAPLKTEAPDILLLYN